MLGQHPQAYGFPELNLFVAETVEELLLTFSGYRQIQLHGLLRTVAELYAGEQTVAAIDMARRWLLVRRERSTRELYYELCAKIAPLRGIDKSPAYVHRQATLQRLVRAFPDAYFLHLTRNPLDQGRSVLNAGGGIMAVLTNSIDYTTDPPTLDPQIAWFETQQTILDFLERIDDRRKLQLRGEDVLAHPQRGLLRLCRWLGLADDEPAITAMMHPEDSPYARLGPFGAHLGNDVNFLRSPAIRPGAVILPPLSGPLPWRRDGRGFREEVVNLAHALGYE